MEYYEIETSLSRVNTLLGIILILFAIVLSSIVVFCFLLLFFTFT